MNIKIHKKQPIFNNYVITAGSLNDIEIAGSLINQGFPFFVLAKCLQFFEISCVYKAFQNIL